MFLSAMPFVLGFVLPVLILLALVVDVDTSINWDHRLPIERLRLPRHTGG